MSTNVAVVVGTLSRDPELRDLPSGDTVLGLEVTVRPEGGTAETVNVAWYDAPVAAERWRAGDEILVTGRTRRRFFRAGGGTQSRTELVATLALPTRRAAAARSALAAASAQLLGALDP
jgi:single-strand DNA-binding protein